MAQYKTISLQAETILLALGRSPNIEGLGLEQIGVDGSEPANPISMLPVMSTEGRSSPMRLAIRAAS